MPLHEMLALIEANHDGELLNKAEGILSDFADEDSSLYLINPDGETIKVQKGCKLLYIHPVKSEIYVR